MSGPAGGGPSGLFLAERERLREAGRLGPVADLACGRGRQALPAAEAGLALVGIDRSREHLAALQAEARARHLDVSPVCADLESDRGIPLRAGSCGAVLVFRFLYRPLATAIAGLLRPGGLLLYETFSWRQPELGWGPRRREFLLAEGELPALFPDLEILEAWEGVTEAARPEAVGRLVARRRPA